MEEAGLDLISIVSGAVIGAFLTLVLQELLPGQIRYKVRMARSKLIKWISDTRVRTVILWNIIPLTKYNERDFINSVIDKLVERNVKCTSTPKGIEFMLKYGLRELEGIIKYSLDVEDDVEYVDRIAIEVNIEPRYRMYSEELFEVFNAINSVIKPLIVNIVGESKSSVIVESELKRLEALTGILKDLKVTYMVLGNNYRIDLSERKIKVIDLIDAKIIQLLKSIIALYG